MRNIKNQLITIPESIIERYWNVYKSKCVQFESLLESKPHDIFFNNKIHNTGAFKLPVENNSKKTKLYRLFISEKTNVYTIKKGNNYLLRGVNYFPDILPLPTFEKYTRLEQSFLELYRNIVNSDFKEENLMIYLATIDYIKNYLLILLHLVHVLQSRSTKIADLISEQEYYEFQLVIENVAEDFISTWETHKPTRSKIGDTLPSIVKKFLSITKKCLKNFNVSESDKINLFRSYRENNHPIKLLSFAKELSHSYLNKTLLIGIEYGGIELPFLVNAYRAYFGKNKLNKVIVNVSTYSEQNANNVDSLLDIIPMFIRDPKLDQFTKVLLLDDSITTGRTISVITSVLPENIQEVYLATLSVTLSNRYHHLTRNGHGGLNPFILNSMFSKYKSNYTSTYTKKSYTNKSGIFNKEKNSIKRLLRETYFNNILKNG